MTVQQDLAAVREFLTSPEGGNPCDELEALDRIAAVVESERKLREFYEWLLVFTGPYLPPGAKLEVNERIRLLVSL